MIPTFPDFISIRELETDVKRAVRRARTRMSPGSTIVVLMNPWVYWCLAVAFEEAVIVGYAAKGEPYRPWVTAPDQLGLFGAVVMPCKDIHAKFDVFEQKPA